MMLQHGWCRCSGQGVRARVGGGLTWLGDALKVKHENEERAEARRQEQASFSGHPHPEARGPLAAASTRFIRGSPRGIGSRLMNCGKLNKKSRQDTPE